MPSSKSSIAVFIKNGSDKEAESKLTLNSKGTISNFSLDFKPFESKFYILDQGESLTLNGEVISNPFRSKFNFLNLIVILMLIGLSLFFSRKEFKFKRVFSKFSFYIIILIVTLLLLFLNVKLLVIALQLSYSS